MVGGGFRGRQPPSRLVRLRHARPRRTLKPDHTDDLCRRVPSPGLLAAGKFIPPQFLAEAVDYAAMLRVFVELRELLQRLAPERHKRAPVVSIEIRESG